ncbi:VWA domain-containing protein [Candidatus Woesearchaeota archaeon]|nr:VWA domain-containing protein [Candidatus Woesearchaeota archaeon]
MALTPLQHERGVVRRHTQRFLDNLTRREFLAISGMALGGLALLGSKVFAGDDGLDLPIERPRRQRPEDLWVPSDEQRAEPEPEDPPTFYNEVIPAEHSIIYVLDRSLSMDTNIGPGIDPEGMLIRRGTRFARAISELKASIRSLPRRFRFNIVVYHCELQAWQQHMVDACDDNKSDAYRWLSTSVWPAGATGTGVAVSYALQEEDNHDVVLLTDGAPNCGVDSGTDLEMMARHRRMIRDSNRYNARVHVFGIDAYADFLAFCVGVASDTGGSYYGVR